MTYILKLGANKTKKFPTRLAAIRWLKSKQAYHESLVNYYYGRVIDLVTARVKG
jgi:hypothetical protein